MKGPVPRSPTERFWSKVNKDGPVPAHRPELGPCWEWTGTTHDGYGRLYRVNGKTHVRVHRFAVELLRGPIPEGLEPDHLCRNRACVKAIADEHGPAHIEVVTHGENVRRGRLGSQRERTHCKRGHPFDAENTYVTATGARACRACNAEHHRRYRGRA